MKAKRTNPKGSTRELPSAIEICLSECDVPSRTRKLAKDKRFIRELQDQALHDLGEFPYVDTLDCTDPLDPGQFIVYASNDLSPFLPDGKCFCAPCRLRYAQTFARGVGLYADVVVLSDRFSGELIRTSPGDSTGDDLVDWMQHLRCLEPLMRGGVIRFSRWIYSRCSACGEVARRAEKEIAARLLEDIWRTQGLEISYGQNRGGLFPAGTSGISIFSPVMTGADGPLWLRTGLTKTFEKTLQQSERAARKNNGVHATLGKKLQRYFNPRLLPELREFVDAAIFSVSMGRMCSATVATDSPLGARVMSYLDELDIFPSQVNQRWELPPTSELPWLRGLSPEDVMRIRSEAHAALPAFRALIRSKLFAEENQRASTVEELRAQIAEVESELRQLHIVKRRSMLLSASGLLLAVYGFGTRNPAIIGTGLAGFVSSLAAAHNSASQAELREHALTHKPAHLLLTAGSTAHSTQNRPRDKK
jgi:hypothetical protein